VATLADLDRLALELPETTKTVEEGRPSYLVHGKWFCFHRRPRKDAVDPDTGERLDVDELHDVVVDAWLVKAQKRVAKKWLAEQSI
jgi:hypothetical protein